MKIPSPRSRDRAGGVPLDGTHDAGKLWSCRRKLVRRAGSSDARHHGSCAQEGPDRAADADDSDGQMNHLHPPGLAIRAWRIGSGEDHEADRENGRRGQRPTDEVGDAVSLGVLREQNADQRHHGDGARHDPERDRCQLPDRRDHIRPPILSGMNGKRA
nr:hypothetical protein [Microbacterium saperdae]